MITTTETTTVSGWEKVVSVLLSVGWVVGFEPTATGTTITRVCRHRSK
jgi:hypothetical protein